MKNNFISNREKPIDLKGINRKIKFLVLTLIALLPLANSLVGQTTVFSDAFTRTSPSPESTTSTPAEPYNMTYTIGSSTSPAGVTAISSNVLQLYGPSSAVNGREYMTGSSSTFAYPYISSTLHGNSGDITWSFNMRAQRSSSSTGFDAGAYGLAVILASNNADPTNSGANGYAVVLRKNVNASNAISLVSFAGGLTANANTAAIIGPSADLASYTSYTSVKVIYTPSTNTWQLYYRDDTTNASVDPLSGAAFTQVGTGVANTLYTTAPSYTNFGWFYNHSTATSSSNKSMFDNFKVQVNVPVTWTSGYPKADTPTPTGFTAKANLNVAGKAYYVVVANGATAPSSAQVKAGLNNGGTAAIASGSITCAAGSTEYAAAAGGALANSTAYDVYYVAEDASGSNLQSSVSTVITVTTTASATAPLIQDPTATAILINSATLGGNITSNGGATITDRGTVWSTSTGVGIGDNKLDETGRTTGIFTHSRTSLPAKSKIYYKAYASNSAGTTLTTTEGNFYTLAVEPTTQVTALPARAASATSITLNWTAATDADGYFILIRQSTSAPSGLPTDATIHALGATIGLGTVAAYVTSGSATSCTISGLTASTIYSFKVCSYNADGVNAGTYNYNTTSAPTVLNTSTLAAPVLSVSAGTLTGMKYELGSGPSTSLTYNISGTNLVFPGDVTITGSSSYEVSSDNFSFAGTASVHFTSATLSATPVYVRLKAGLSVGTYNSETVANTGGGAASSANVTCSGYVVALPTTYTWTGSTSTDWQVSTNWSPTRTTPAVNDILQFNNGTTNTITNVPTQAIDQLLISNNTTVELQSTSSVALTINGTTGDDLIVQAGSALNVAQATNTITLAIATGATGTVAGTISLSTAAHKLTAVDANGITFQNGSTFTAGTGFSSNAFGTTGTANSVVFASGSKYICYSGSNPMALTAPASIVVWQTGSTFVHKATTPAPSLAGRTYANFELDEPTGTSFTTSSAVTVDNLIITNGNWSLGVKALHTINGNISVASGATLNLNPTTAGTITLKGDINVASGGTLNVSPTVTEAITFSGTGAQAVNNAGTFSSTSGASYIVANTVGVNIASNVSFPTLTINSGGILNVNGGKQLTVGTTLSNSGTLNMLSDNTNGTATIITPATLGGSGGTYNVQQYLAAGRNWYISSPVTGGLSSTFNAANSSNKLYWYDEVHGTSAPWPTISDNATGLTVMKGYVANMAVDGAVTFSGTLNTGSQTINVSRTSGQDKEGFNLIGNPYASYLDWNQATKSASLQTSIWQRTKNGGDAWVFDTYNSTGNQYLNNSGKGINNHIPPMQAFWVRVDNSFSTGSVTVDNTMRSHQGSVTILGNPITDPVFKSHAALTQSTLRLQVSNGTNTDDAVIYSNSGASNSFDAYDSPKMFNNSAYIAEIFTLAGTEDVAINGLNTIPNDTEIPLGFSTVAAGSFSIKASQISDFAVGTQIVLKDYLNVSNPVITDLSDGSSYSFTSDATSNNTSRFTLIFRAPSIATGINTVNGNVWISTNANGQLLINGTVNGETSVSVYNAVGQRVAAKNLTSNVNVLDTRLVPGVYTITLTNAGKSATTKVIIK